MRGLYIALDFDHTEINSLGLENVTLSKENNNNNNKSWKPANYDSQWNASTEREEICTMASQALSRRQTASENICVDRSPWYSIKVRHETSLIIIITADERTIRYCMVQEHHRKEYQPIDTDRD